MLISPEQRMLLDMLLITLITCYTYVYTHPLTHQTHLILPRCDQTSNCYDESDEDNCKLLFMKVGG